MRLVIFIILTSFFYNTTLSFGQRMIENDLSYILIAYNSGRGDSEIYLKIYKLLKQDWESGKIKLRTWEEEEDVSTIWDFDIDQINKALKTELHFQNLSNEPIKNRRPINSTNRLIGTINDIKVELYIKNYKTKEEAIEYIRNILHHLAVGPSMKNRFLDESYTFTSSVSNRGNIYLRKGNIYTAINTEESYLIRPVVDVVLKQLINKKQE